MNTGALVAIMLALLIPLIILILILHTIYRPPLVLIHYLQRRYPDVLFHHPDPRPKSKTRIALTIDDTPSAHTASILRILTRHNVHATFFIIGSQVPGHEPILRDLILAGHELGNHTMHDEPSYRLGDDTLRSQIETVDNRINDLYTSLNIPPPPPETRYFRPGSGFFHSRMRALSKKLGYRLVLGSIYPHDAQIRSWRLNAWHVLSTVQSGGIVVCHDRAWTVAMLDRVVPEVKKRGIGVGTVSELLEAE